jgi:hypothetical protein
MPAPKAMLAHETPGRTRLRIADKIGDRDYFERMRQALSSCPGVRHVSVSPLTGSLLVMHGNELAIVREFARERDLFEVVAAAQPLPFTHLKGEVQRLDDRLRTASGERWGVAGLTFYGLVGASLWQLVQGRVFPPSITLAFQALNLFKQALEAEAERARSVPR